MNRDYLRAKAEAARDAIAAHAALNEDEPAERRAYARMEEAVEALREALTPDVVLALLGVVDLAVGAPSNNGPHGILCAPFDPAALRAKALADWRTLAEAADEGYDWQYAEDYPVVVLRTLGAPIVCRVTPEMDDTPGGADFANGRFIAYSHPRRVLSLLAAYAALLSERDALVAENARLTQERDANNDALVDMTNLTDQYHRERDALAARVADLEAAIHGLSPSSPHHDCMFCEEWYASGAHGEDCITQTLAEAAPPAPEEPK